MVTTPVVRLIFASWYVAVVACMTVNAVPSVAVGSTVTANSLAAGAVVKSMTAPPWTVSMAYSPVPEGVAPSR